MACGVTGHTEALNVNFAPINRILVNVMEFQATARALIDKADTAIEKATTAHQTVIN